MRWSGGSEEEEEKEEGDWTGMYLTEKHQQQQQIPSEQHVARPTLPYLTFTHIGPPHCTDSDSAFSDMALRGVWPGQGNMGDSVEHDGHFPSSYTLCC